MNSGLSSPASTAGAINPAVNWKTFPPLIRLEGTRVRDGTVGDSWPTGNQAGAGTGILELITPSFTSRTLPTTAP